LSTRSLHSKLALGTVQLGLPYGINNQNGKPDFHEATRILDLAFDSGIRILDTAEAYGNSLEVISSYLKKHPASSFKIISKFIGSDTTLEKGLASSLETLSTDNLYGYMYHRFSDYVSGKFRTELATLKEQKKIKNTGVSLYSIEELEAVVDDESIDMIQLPFNFLDASREKKDLMARARENGKEIHVRSVFLQGLFYKNSKELSGNMRELSPVLEKFHDILGETDMNVTQACLNFALHQPFIDFVVIGVETAAQLQSNINSILPDIDEQVFEKLESIHVSNQALVNPGSWKP
jgi:aryl-alcohol dehydrogenase-like predicted oxidoreductase